MEWRDAVSFGKADAKGRSSNRYSGRAGKLRKPPAGEPWAWLTRELLTSEAWRALGVNSRKLMDFLLIEHMNHAGTENGHLIATKDQLVAFGLSRRLIADAVRECNFFGLLRFERGGLSYGDIKRPSRYRLTFYADKDGAPATNEWKAVTAERVEDWRRGRRRMRAAPAAPNVAALREDI